MKLNISQIIVFSKKSLNPCIKQHNILTMCAMILLINLLLKQYLFFTLKSAEYQCPINTMLLGGMLASNLLHKSAAGNLHPVNKTCFKSYFSLPTGNPGLIYNWIKTGKLYTPELNVICNRIFFFLCSRERFDFVCLLCKQSWAVSGQITGKHKLLCFSFQA